jgi:hypothetical protein
MKRNNKKQTPSLTDKVKANQEETKRILAEAAQIQQRAAKQIKENLESILIRRLAALSGQEPLNYDEIESVISQLERVRGTNEAPRVNHCKTCLFQKLCPDYSEDGRKGLSCGFVPYNNKLRQQLKEAQETMKEDPEEKIQVYDKSLIYWNDTQDQLDSRFILS